MKGGIMNHKFREAYLNIAKALGRAAAGAQ